MTETVCRVLQKKRYQFSQVIFFPNSIMLGLSCFLVQEENNMVDGLAKRYANAL